MAKENGGAVLYVKQMQSTCFVGQQLTRWSFHTLITLIAFLTRLTVSTTLTSTTFLTVSSVLTCTHQPRYSLFLAES